MKYWVAICSTFAWGMHNEAIAWICLVLIAVPFFAKFVLRYGEIVERENATYTGKIDDDGFYL